MRIDNVFTTHPSQRRSLETTAHRAALERLIDGLGAREPFLLVTGEAGVGKTALVHDAVEGWGERATVAFLTNPALTRTELVEEVARRFGAKPRANVSKPQLLAALEGALEEIAKRGQVAVLVIDDAHDLATELLSELRLLANAAAQASRALEIALVGLPSLTARLSEQELAPLQQRVSVHCELAPFTHKETRRYLHQCVEAAGGDGPTRFPRETCREIYRRTRGVPRAINTLAAEAMRRARDAGSEAVLPEHVQAAGATSWTGAAAPSSHERQAPPDPVERPPGSTALDSKRENDRDASSAAPPPAPSERGADEIRRRIETPKHPPAPPAIIEPAPAANAEPAVVAHAEPAPAAITEPETAAHGELATAADAELLVPAPAPRRSAASASSEARVDDRRAREWVARFIGDQGPPRIGCRLEMGVMNEVDDVVVRSHAEFGSSSGTTGDDGDPTDPASFAGMDAAAREGAEPARSRRGGKRLGPRPTWRIDVNAMLAIALLVLAVLGVLILIPQGARLFPRETAFRQAAQESAREATEQSSTTRQTQQTTQQTIPDPASAASNAAAPPDARPTESPADETTPVSSAPAEPQSEPAAHPAYAASAPTEEGTESDVGSAAPAPSGLFGLEVGVYTRVERAEIERDRLAATSGLQAWVVSDPARASHRVVLGVFSTARRAESSANILIERSLVSEARVIPLPPRSARR